MDPSRSRAKQQPVSWPIGKPTATTKRPEANVEHPDTSHINHKREAINTISVNTLTYRRSQENQKK
jgi:hypothetical protein